jgi:rhamnosyltransferase
LLTKNGSATLGDLLSSIRRQRSDKSFEVLAVDSGSTDGSLELLALAGARIHQIPPAEFSHSRTRNLGARLARARKYLVFQNQDAIPSGDGWLAGLVRAMEWEPGIRAACALELDPEVSPPFNVSGISSLAFGHSMVCGIYVMNERLLRYWDELPKARLRYLYSFTTVSSIFDRDYFLSHPFNSTVEYGEDLHWAVDAVRAGQRVACTSWAQVVHPPPETEKQYMARLRLDMDLGVAVFGDGYRRRFSRVAWALGLQWIARGLTLLVRSAARFLSGL